jgi:HEPN domain-containing protein
MISTRELRKLASARIKDSQVLLAGGRFDGAVYLCGYAIELALKARICRTLKWPGYPSTKKEFEGFLSFKIHRLDLLLTLCGQEVKIKTNYFADWSTVAGWDPELRYSLVGTASRQDAIDMIDSATTLMRVL